MTAIRQTLVYCDGDGCCGLESEPWRVDFFETEHSAAWQRKQMKREGWKQVGSKDYCPECVKKLKEVKP